MAVKYKERKRLAYICAQAGLINVDDPVDYKTIMCGLAFFAEGTPDEKLRFMMSLFLDPEGDDESGEYFLESDPKSRYGDQVQEFLESLISGIMMHSGMPPRRWATQTDSDGQIAFSGWVKVNNKFNPIDEAASLAHEIMEYLGKPLLYGLTDVEILTFYKETENDPPGFIYYLINSGRYNVKPPRITDKQRPPSKVLQQKGVDSVLTLEVVCEATPPVAYQWTRDGEPVVNGNAATLEIKGVSVSDSGSYHCWIKNVMGTVVSRRCAVKISDADAQHKMTARRDRKASMSSKAAIKDLRLQVPIIEQLTYYPPPSSYRHGKFLPGMPVAFVAKARVHALPNGSDGEMFTKPLRFDWYNEDEHVQGEHDCTMLCHRADRKYYKTKVTTQSLLSTDVFEGNSADSDNVRLPLDPVVLSQSISKTVLSGNNVTLSLDVESHSPVSYQWFKDSKPFDHPGRFTNMLLLTKVSSRDEARYHCQIANDNGICITVPTVVQVDCAPEINPNRQLRKRMEVPESNKLALRIAMSAGAPPFHYLWVKDSFPIDCANTPEFVVDSAQLAHSGVYYCIVSNALGVVKSSPCTVRVTTRLAWLCMSIVKCKCIRVALQCRRKEFRKEVRDACCCKSACCTCWCGKGQKHGWHRRGSSVAPKPVVKAPSSPSEDLVKQATSDLLTQLQRPLSTDAGSKRGVQGGADGMPSAMSFVQVSEDAGGRRGSAPGNGTEHGNGSGNESDHHDDRKAQMEMAFSTSALSKLSRVRQANATSSEVLVVEASADGRGRVALGKLAKQATARVEDGAIAILSHADEAGGGKMLRLHEMKARIHQEKLRQQVCKYSSIPFFGTSSL
jgi:hypothetical protein